MGGSQSKPVTIDISKHSGSGGQVKNDGRGYFYNSGSGRVNLTDDWYPDPEGIYRKFTHRPRDGCTIGDIKKGGTSQNGFFDNLSQYSSVSVYYWSQDHSCTRPLLIQFGNGDEYYTTNGRGTWNNPGGITTTLRSKLDGQNCGRNKAHIINITEKGGGTPYRCSSCKASLRVYNGGDYYGHSGSRSFSGFTNASTWQTGLPSLNNVGTIKVYWNSFGDVKPIVIAQQPHAGGSYRWFRRNGGNVNSWIEVSDEPRTKTGTSATVSTPNLHLDLSKPSGTYSVGNTNIKMAVLRSHVGGGYYRYQYSLRGSLFNVKSVMHGQITLIAGVSSQGTLISVTAYYLGDSPNLSNLVLVELRSSSGGTTYQYFYRVQKDGTDWSPYPGPGQGTTRLQGELLEQALDTLKKVQFPAEQTDSQSIGQQIAEFFQKTSVYEFADCGSLMSLENFEEPIPQFPKEVVRCITKDIVSALDYLSGIGVAHRDVKPDNIFMTSDGRFKLGDFGESCLMEDGKVKGSKGSLYFVAPEAFSLDSESMLDGSALDMWALGITILMLYFSKFPFKNPSSAVMKLFDEIQEFSVKERVEELKRDNIVEDDFVDFICRILDKDPKNRIKPDRALDKRGDKPKSPQGKCRHGFNASWRNVYNEIRDPHYKVCHHKSDITIISRLTYSGIELKDVENGKELTSKHNTITEVFTYYSYKYDEDDKEIKRPLALRLKERNGRAYLYYNADADKDENKGHKGDPLNTKWEEIKGGNKFYDGHGEPKGNALREKLDHLTCKLHKLNIVDIFNTDRHNSNYSCKACSKYSVTVSKDKIFEEYTKYEHKYTSKPNSVRYDGTILEWEDDGKYTPIPLGASEISHLTVYYWDKDKNHTKPLVMEVAVGYMPVPVGNDGKEYNNKWTIMKSEDLEGSVSEEQLQEQKCKLFKPVVIDVSQTKEYDNPYCENKKCREGCPENVEVNDCKEFVPFGYIARRHIYRKSEGNFTITGFTNGPPGSGLGEKDFPIFDAERVIVYLSQCGDTEIPLLVYVGSNGENGKTQVNKWYSRSSVDKNDWKEEDGLGSDPPDTAGNLEIILKGIKSELKLNCTGEKPATPQVTVTRSETDPEVGQDQEAVEEEGEGAVATRKLLELVKDLIPTNVAQLEPNKDSRDDGDDQVPDTESETKILLQGTPVVNHGVIGTGQPPPAVVSDNSASAVEGLSKTVWKTVSGTVGPLIDLGVDVAAKLGPVALNAVGTYAAEKLVENLLDSSTVKAVAPSIPVIDSDREVGAAGAPVFISAPLYFPGGRISGSSATPRLIVGHSKHSPLPGPFGGSRGHIPAGYFGGTTQFLSGLNGDLATSTVVSNVAGPPALNPQQLKQESEAQLQQSSVSGPGTPSQGSSEDHPQDIIKISLSVTTGILGTSALACFAGFKYYRSYRGDPWVRQI
ncbi:protein kinase domain containing protein [Theileria equi strain WA]|uniref:mitogen-activated protein kinase kinase n=1 Tax=Theileria equi strain WA TaxID=1537102 RepID=L0AVL3_THEEQ|nr:protein kinase domain containing protein [Theileria equi strain WA]AFZ79590.1 protein kinase domain containing protein [Theileria equi strain WA]|eukprot:XP_004829256.1 protein kinase domain containing protein [Theileria equi strain WA]